MLRGVDAGIATSEGEQPRFESVLARIDEKIAELTAVRRRLRLTLARCRDGRCTFREKKAAASGRKARKAS